MIKDHVADKKFVRAKDYDRTLIKIFVRELSTLSRLNDYHLLFLCVCVWGGVAREKSQENE